MSRSILKTATLASIALTGTLILPANGRYALAAHANDIPIQQLTEQLTPDCAAATPDALRYIRTHHIALCGYSAGRTIQPYNTVSSPGTCGTLTLSVYSAGGTNARLSVSINSSIGAIVLWGHAIPWDSSSGNYGNWNQIRVAASSNVSDDTVVNAGHGEIFASTQNVTMTTFYGFQCGGAIIGAQANV